MFNNKKIIIFRESDKIANTILDIPKAASHSVPDWYRKDKNFTNNTNSYLESFKQNHTATYKMCVPLSDSIISGYNILLPASVMVTNIGSNDEYQPRIDWMVDWNVCDTIPNNTLQNYPIPYKHSSTPFRWILNWNIITPSGYSLWITHPSHRYDLPFTTINGFVDSDLHPNHLLLPFFIRDGFEGIIEADTPIGQVIPIKRDSWDSVREEYDPDLQLSSFNKIKLDFFRTYKNRYWEKKNYR